MKNYNNLEEVQADKEKFKVSFKRNMNKLVWSIFYLGVFTLIIAIVNLYNENILNKEIRNVITIIQMVFLFSGFAYPTYYSMRLAIFTMLENIFKENRKAKSKVKVRVSSRV